MSRFMVGAGFISALIFGSMMDSPNLTIPVIGLIISGLVISAGLAIEYAREKFKEIVDAEVNRRIRERRYEDEV